MKSMKKCRVTQNKISIINKLRNRRDSSAGMFYTSSAGAVTSLILWLKERKAISSTSLILMFGLTVLFSLTGATNLFGFNLFGLNGSAYADYTLSMTSSGAQNINVAPGNSNGGGSSIGTSIGEDAITVSTTCRSGYNLSLSTSVDDNKLYLSGNSSSSSYFTPVDGTSTLASSSNKWGYYYNSSSSTAPTNASVFSIVPALGSTATIKSPLPAPSSTDIEDSFSIYYGVGVNSNLTPGTYKMKPDTNNSNADGTVVYYLTMAQYCLPYTVNFNPTSTAGGTTISGTGTMNPQSIPVGVATALNSNTFTAPTGYEFDSWNTAQDGTGTSYQDGASATNLTSGGQSITLYAQWKVDDPCIGHESELYCKVKAQSKGTQTLDQFRATITTSNSGVYEYDTSVFGAASDAASDHTIYYYRGILDKTTGTYGSDGDNAKYPNTVVLSSASSRSGLKTTDTCWRIVRTTGSGGVKMIYQGKWTAAGTSGNCKNTGTNASTAANDYFRRRSSSSTNYYDTLGRIIYVGYSMNATASLQTSTTSTANSTLFATGTNASEVRSRVEGWSGSNIASWRDSKLETSAGWCNDRTTYSGKTTNTKTTSNIPYSTSTAVYFGAYIRNNTTNSRPTLGCPQSRDLLTTSNGMSYPIALLTADEAAFAGSGDYSNTHYHVNSFLDSGSDYWLMSPLMRSSSGVVYEFYINSSGCLGAVDAVSVAKGMRPTISLISGAISVSGSGTATNPWIVNP